MVVSKLIAEIKATANIQPKGYVDYLLSRGKIEGDTLVLDDEAQDDIRDKYPLPGQSGVFSAAKLQAGAPYQPAGYVDFVLSRAKIRGDIVILDNRALDELSVKFPLHTRAQVHKVAEVIANPHRRPPAMVAFMLKHGKVEGEFLVLEPATVQQLNNTLDQVLTVKQDIAQLMDHAHQRPEGFVDYLLAHARIQNGTASLHIKLIREIQQKFPAKNTQTKFTQSELAAEAGQRPPGYLDQVRSRGRVEGDVVILEEPDLNDINQKFPAPIKFDLAQLKASARRRPKGLMDYVLTQGKMEGNHVILDSASAREFRQKFPASFLIPPCEPTLAEMASNFSGAMAGWAKVGFKTVEREVYEKRLAVCNSCEHWEAKSRGGMGKCKICGCSKFKFWLSSSVCPDKPPRW